MCGCRFFCSTSTTVSSCPQLNAEMDYNMIWYVKITLIYGINITLSFLRSMIFSYPGKLQLLILRSEITIINSEIWKRSKTLNSNNDSVSYYYFTSKKRRAYAKFHGHADSKGWLSIISRFLLTCGFDQWHLLITFIVLKLNCVQHACVSYVHGCTSLQKALIVKNNMVVGAPGCRHRWQIPLWLHKVQEYGIRF